MFELIYKDTVLTRGTNAHCRNILATIIKERKHLEFWQEISYFKRTDFFYYDSRSPHLIIIYSILPA